MRFEFNTRFEHSHLISANAVYLELDGLEPHR